MKHSVIKAIVMFVCLLTTTSCKAQKIFQELADNPDVESVYVGKAMMSMAKGAMNFSGDADMQIAKDAIKGINSVEIITCEKSSAIPAVQKKARQILSQLNLEVLLETRDGKELCTIYGKTPAENSKESYISDMIIEASEPGEYSLIHINGKIDVAALMAASKE